MRKSKVIIKERDEWSSLAEFLGNMIAKYVDVIDFDSLPDADKFLTNREMWDSYRIYSRERNKRVKRCIHIDFEMVA